MFSIILITTILTAMIGVSMSASKHYLLTPQFGLLLCFILALIGCLANVERWDLDFSGITTEVVLLGFTTIVIISLIFQKLFKINKALYITHQKVDGSEINIYKGRLIIWTMVQIINLILVARFLISNTGALTLQMAINSYRNTIYLTGDVEALPFITRIVRSMCVYSGFMFIYILFYNIVNKVKSNLNIYYIINISCAAISSLLIGGSRGSLLQYLIAGITIYFSLYTFKYYKSFSIKQVLRIIIVLGLFVILFGQMSIWLGRGEVENLGDTIFTYLSGGMANLDTYLKQSMFYQTDKNYTFSELINFYYRLTGQSHMQYRGFLANTYMVQNGFRTGNIYTMFASFYHDGKMIAVIVFCALMSFIGQWILSLSIKRHENGKINIPLIIYGYLFFDFAQCNFSNRFYLQFFADNMIKFAFFLFIFRIFLTTKKIRCRITRGGFNNYA